MNLKNTLNKIIEDRNKEYMNYQDFCDLTKYIKQYIHLKFSMDNLDYNQSIEEYLKLHNEKYHYMLNNNVEFTKTMLAMKAIRSLTVSKTLFENCIIDFVNYKRLFIQSIEYYMNCLNSFNCNIIFDIDIFNEELNEKYIDIEKIDYIVNDRAKEQLLGMRNYPSINFF